MKELVMLLIKQYKQFVAGKLDWIEALETHLGSKKYLSDAVVESLAEAHAEAYGNKYHTTIFYRQTSSDRWSFYTNEDCTSESLHTTALRQWQRDVQQYQKVKESNRGGANGKAQKDVVDIGRRKAEKFAESHKVVEIRNEIKLVEAYLKSLKAYA
jgi:hypothetical protein